MKRFVPVVLCVLIILSGLSLAQSQAAGNVVARASVVPNLLTVSGTTGLNQKAMSGVLGMTFALYKDQEGGAALWLETQSVAVDKGGHYSVSLGVTKADGLPADIFTSGEAKWLGVQIEGQVEQSRVLLLSVPYALKAADAETIGGLPPSAFMLAAPVNTGATVPADATSSGASTSSAPPPATITGTGTANFVPLFTGASTIGNSVVFQSGTGATAKVGINTITPGTTLDVKGAANVQGLFTSPATGTATATGGKASQAHNFVASSFNSSTSAAVNQTFQWKAEASGNNTATPSGTLNLLFGSGTANPTETGLKLSSKGVFTFATGQTFPGAGTITGVTAGTDLTGGGTSGSVTLNLDTTKVPLLATANTFTAGQTVKGNVTLSGSGNGVIFADGSKQTTAATGGGGSGTVTSVGLAAPGSDFTVSGSPVTTAGTLSLGWTTAPTSVNAANAIVKRDSGGSFSANTVTATTVSAGTVTVTNLNPTGTVTINTANPTALSGNSSNTNGTAIFGTASATSGASWGILGTSASSDATAKGVAGTALSGTGNTEGVNGVSESFTGIGVMGQASSNAFSRGATSLLGTAAIGTMGDSPDVFGIGVAGSANDGYGGFFVNNSPNWGIPTLEIQTVDANFTGYFMEADYNAGQGVLVTQMLLDDFGNLELAGTISKAGGSFKIDHPVDPANKYLYHSFVESPDMMNIYNGLVVLDDAGAASVTLPDWFEALNRDFRYQLTSIGAPGPNLYIAEEVTGNQFKIAGGKPGAKVSWQVTGVRHDAWANAHRIPTEVEKMGAEKGKYIHPELFGLSRRDFGIRSKTAGLHKPVAKKNGVAESGRLLTTGKYPQP